MSVTLIENPVVTEDGILKNIFAGFEPVEYVFKREDLSITGVSQGISNQLLIPTSIDLSSYLSIGDSVYVFSEGSTFTYDETGIIVAITASTITISVDFIEAGVGGYINYYKNYHLEVELVNVDNSDVKVLPFTLKDDGNNAGDITIDVSITNDLNIQFFEFLQQEMTESRTLFKVQYREVWDILTGSYTLLTDRVILVYATQQPEIEEFINELDNPKIWKGYPFGIILVHSSDNSDETGVTVSYDELDINQNVIVADQSLGSFLASDEGFLFVDLDKDKSYNANTEYIKFKGGFISAKFFSSEFFDDNFFDA